MNIILHVEEWHDLCVCYYVYINRKQKRPYLTIDDTATTVMFQARTLEVLLSAPQVPHRMMNTVTCTPAQWRDMLKIITEKNMYSPAYAEAHQHLHQILTSYALAAHVEEALTDTTGVTR